MVLACTKYIHNTASVPANTVAGPYSKPVADFGVSFQAQNTGLPRKSGPKAKTDILTPTFWRTILNILDFQQSGMIEIIKTVQALFQILA